MWVGSAKAASPFEAIRMSYQATTNCLKHVSITQMSGYWQGTVQTLNDGQVMRLSIIYKGFPHKPREDKHDGHTSDWRIDENK